MRIAVIGLGGIGGGVATSLLRGGHEVIGYDLSAERCDLLAAAGGRVASDASEAAAQTDLVFACLPSAAASLETSRRVAAAGGARHYIELSTLGRDTIREIAATIEEAAIGFADAPVSGGPPIARAGQLSTVISGPAETITFARPAMESFARKIFVVGDRPGLAQVCKLVNNMLSITAFVATCEAITVGVKAGADAAAMIDFINESTGRNSATLEKFPRAILPRRFSDGGPLSIGQKDLGLFLDLAREMEAPTLVGSTVANLFNIVAAEIGPDADYSNMIRVFEAWADVELPATTPAA